MATHLPNTLSPSERLAQYRKLSEEARECAVHAADIEITAGFLKRAVEWDTLAEMARIELSTASVPPLWGQS